MHELSILKYVLDTVESVVEEQNLTKVGKIVLEIGELSEVIPGYLREVYPAAVFETIFEETELEIVMVKGNVICSDCRKVYRFLEHSHECPYCASQKKEIISGNGFNIKEILAY